MKRLLIGVLLSLAVCGTIVAQPKPTVFGGYSTTQVRAEDWWAELDVDTVQYVRHHSIMAGGWIESASDTLIPIVLRIAMSLPVRTRLSWLHSNYDYVFKKYRIGSYMLSAAPMIGVRTPREWGLEALVGVGPQFGVGIFGVDWEAYPEDSEQYGAALDASHVALPLGVNAAARLGFWFNGTRGLAVTAEYGWTLFDPALEEDYGGRETAPYVPNGPLTMSRFSVALMLLSR